MKTIKLNSQGHPDGAWHNAKEGDVWTLFIHGLKYSPELRAHPPRVRLLEDARPGGHTDCELIDEWPDAPAYWPPESAPAPTRTMKTNPAANQGRKSA